MFPSFPPKILGGFRRKTTLQELLGTMGLEPTDCGGKMPSISHKVARLLVGPESAVRTFLVDS